MLEMPIPAVLQGRFISLAPLDLEADSDELFAISHADERAKSLFTYLPRGPFDGADDLKQFFTAWCSDPAVMAFVVRDRTTKAALGTLSLMSVRPEHGVAEIGNVWYAPAAQRTKTNTESVYLLLRYCFEQFRYRRIEWKCDTRNRPSGMAALRLGFSFDGIFRQHMIVRGRNRDTAWFSMLDDQWPTRRVALENWLYGEHPKPLSEVHAATLPYKRECAVISEISATKKQNCLED